jgi:molybdopterin molybdotransferase
MDGYAINIKSLENISSPLKVVGVIAAGKRYVKTVKIGEAIRIFTGGEIPKGTNTVVIQENVKKQDNTIKVESTPRKFQNIRKKGFDFKVNSVLLKKGTRLTPKHIALSAAMNYRKLPVIERPSVAIISTGSELVEPESFEANNNIICSSNYGIKTYVEALGGIAADFGIVPDEINSIKNKIMSLNKFDVILTIGGASVGDYDLVKKSIEKELNLRFWKIAMRPGKPLIFGYINNSLMLGLPGNPVSALVCCQLFLKPMINKFLNLPQKINYYEAVLKADLSKNDEREDYLRASFKNGFVTPNKNQDSSSLSALAQSNAFIVRKPFDTAKKIGDLVKILKIDL